MEPLGIDRPNPVPDRSDGKWPSAKVVRLASPAI